MELFWARGYEATSVRDLTRHLGIGQGSRYAAYGDKDGLYRAALDHYRTTLAAIAMRSLEQDTDARSAVRALLIERQRDRDGPDVARDPQQPRAGNGHRRERQWRGDEDPIHGEPRASATT